MALDWNSEISNESEFVLLPEGEYTFKVTKFEKAWFEGSAKVDPCPKAELELTINSPMGTATIKENLLLSEKVEWKLCEFFRCIGQKVHGKGITMNWDTVLGATGKALIYVNTFMGNKGEPVQNNKVKNYLDPAPVEEVLPWEG